MSSHTLPKSPVSFGNLLQWLTIFMLFVVCGCIFVNIRTQQVAKEQNIQKLMREHRDLGIERESVRSLLTQRRSLADLGRRLHDAGSPLAQVAVEDTEQLERPRTAAANPRWTR